MGEAQIHVIKGLGEDVWHCYTFLSCGLTLILQKRRISMYVKSLVKLRTVVNHSVIEHLGSYFNVISHWTYILFFSRKYTAAS